MENYKKSIYPFSISTKKIEKVATILALIKIEDRDIIEYINNTVKLLDEKLSRNSGGGNISRPSDKIVKYDEKTGTGFIFNTITWTNKHHFKYTSDVYVKKLNWVYIFGGRNELFKNLDSIWRMNWINSTEKAINLGNENQTQEISNGKNFLINSKVMELEKNLKGWNNTNEKLRKVNSQKINLLNLQTFF